MSFFFFTSGVIGFPHQLHTATDRLVLGFGSGICLRKVCRGHACQQAARQAATIICSSLVHIHHIHLSPQSARQCAASRLSILCLLNLIFLRSLWSFRAVLCLRGLARPQGARTGRRSVPELMSGSSSLKFLCGARQPLLKPKISGTCLCPLETGRATSPSWERRCYLVPIQ